MIINITESLKLKWLFKLNMIISIIAAIGNNRVIGNKNRLPWDLPADMEHFRKLTIGKPVIMGSLTFESIGKPLPERENIVLTRDPNYKAPGCKIALSLDEALLLAENSPLGKKNKEVMICGGASIYKQYLPRADRMYLTIIESDFEGDAFFPEFNAEEWKEKERITCSADENNPYKYSFLTLERKSPIKKKKIIFLHLTGGPVINGEKFTFTEGGLVHAFTASLNLKDEYDVTVLCLNNSRDKDKQEIEYEGIKFLCLGGPKWLKWSQYGNLDFFKEAHKYINKENPDILIGNNLLASFLISFYPRRIKKIGIIHHLYFAQNRKREVKPAIWLIGWLEKLALKLIKLDGIGVISPLVRDILIKKGCPEKKIVVVGNGINPSSFSFSEKKEQNSLIYIGRLADLKGVENLLEVVSEIKKEVPQTTLHIVGNGPKYKDVKRGIKKLGIENNVIMHGYLGKERIDLLRSSTVYVSASQFEGFGVPLIEAMATGCVPVVSDIYAHRFIFQDKRVGHLVSTKKEMAKRIIGLLKNEDTRSELAKEGRKLIEDKWTQDKVGQRYKKLLQA